MGMHTRASKNVTDRGFSPAVARDTRKRGKGDIPVRTRITQAAATLSEGLSLEGLIRVWAVLEATRVAKPTYALGEGGLIFERALREEIDRQERAKAKTSEDAAITAQLKDLSRRVETLADEIRAAIEKAGEGE